MDMMETGKIEAIVKIENGIRYTKLFNLLDHLPENGELLNGFPVKSSEILKIDLINNPDELYQYDFYEITVLDKDGDDFYIPAAVKNEQRASETPRKSLLFRIAQAMQK